MSQDDNSSFDAEMPVDVDSFMNDLNNRKQDIASEVKPIPAVQDATEGFIRLADFIKKKKIEVSPRSLRAVALKKYKQQIKY